MFEMRLQNIVNALVEQELVGKGRKEEALYFSFDLRVETFHSNQRISRGLHLLYHCYPGTNSVNVFSGVTESPFEKIRKVDWKHETSHDSCWKNLRCINSLYFDMANEINAKEIDAGRWEEKELAPINMQWDTYFQMFNPAFQWIPAVISQDITNESNYRKIVRFFK